MALRSSNTLYDEILNFLVSTPTPEQIVAFQPPEELQQRLGYLLEHNREDVLSVLEQAELDDFLRMNRFMSQLKLRARQKLVMDTQWED